MKKDRQNIQGITFHEIQLGEHEDFSEVQILRTGSFTHEIFGEIDVTEDMFKSFRENFKKKIKKVELAVDYSHFSLQKASGWITDVILKENNTELWIRSEWTPAGRQGILDKEFKYMSADFSENYQDNETGKKFGPTLNGAALTNRPFIKGMDAVLSDIDMSEEKRQAIKSILSDDQKEKLKSIYHSKGKSSYCPYCQANKKGSGFTCPYANKSKGSDKGSVKGSGYNPVSQQKGSSTQK